MRVGRGTWRLVPWILCLMWFLPGPSAAAQLQLGTVRGTVVGPDGAAADGAVVMLLDGFGNPLRSVTATAGQFVFTNVGPGTYTLRAAAASLSATLHGVTVGGALSVKVDLRLSAVASEQVTVRGDDALPHSITTRITLAGEAVRRAPARVRSRGLQDAIATTPGWATEDNGLLHVRGVDDGFLYVLDGVPVYERLDGLFGVAPDPTMIDSVNVLTGYIPPEFGFKAGGVIEIRSARTAGGKWIAGFDAGAGSDRARDFSVLSGGPLGTAAALTVGITGLASSRFLDPVHPDNLHNDGGTLSGGAQLGWNPSSSSSITTIGGFGRSDFDVPHGEPQEQAAQDQRQALRNDWQTASWQRLWSSGTVSQIAAYRRAGAARLAGSARDTPLRTDAGRELRRFGALISVTHQHGGQLLKVGAEASRLRLSEDFEFAVTDPKAAEEADLSPEAMRYTPEQPFRFRDSASPALLSFYVQDSIRVSDALTIDLGVRADWSRLLVAASQWSPRIGAAYRWAATGTTLRGSFGRFFQPPQPENLLLASSEQARELSPFTGDLGSGGDRLLPERQTAIELAVNQTAPGGVRVDVSYWRRRARNVADPNVFFGTTVIFPNAVARGRASGVDVRVEMPPRRGWSAYLSYANSRVVQIGPMTGGLFLEEETLDITPGVAFTPDHDQRHVGAAGVSFAREGSGSSVTISGRYESGTPLGLDDSSLGDLLERPGVELVDLDRGRVRPRRLLDASMAQTLLRRGRVDLSLRLAVLNLTGSRWAYNFGNPFSGTHFGPGRTVQFGIRASSR